MQKAYVRGLNNAQKSISRYEVLKEDAKEKASDDISTSSEKHRKDKGMEEIGGSSTK